MAEVVQHHPQPPLEDSQTVVNVTNNHYHYHYATGPDAAQPSEADKRIEQMLADVEAYDTVLDEIARIRQEDDEAARQRELRRKRRKELEAWVARVESRCEWKRKKVRALIAAAGGPSNEAGARQIEWYPAGGEQAGGDPAYQA